jgi:hypothetical protein
MGDVRQNDWKWVGMGEASGNEERRSREREEKAALRERSGVRGSGVDDEPGREAGLNKGL